MKDQDYINQLELTNDILKEMVLKNSEELYNSNPAQFDICMIAIKDTLDAKNKRHMLAALDKHTTKDPNYWAKTEWRMRNEWWLRPWFRIKIKLLLFKKKWL